MSSLFIFCFVLCFPGRLVRERVIDQNSVLEVIDCTGVERMERQEKVKCKQFYSVSEASNIKLKLKGYAETPSLFPQLEELGCYVI